MVNRKEELFQQHPLQSSPEDPWQKGERGGEARELCSRGFTHSLQPTETKAWGEAGRTETSHRFCGSVRREKLLDSTLAGGREKFLSLQQ